MPLFWLDFSDVLPIVGMDFKGSDVLFDLSGCSLVTVISKPFGSDDMVPVLRIVELKDPLAFDAVDNPRQG